MSGTNKIATTIFVEGYRDVGLQKRKFPGSLSLPASGFKKSCLGLRCPVLPLLPVIQFS
jgi:hypothetical protein